VILRGARALRAWREPAPALGSEHLNANRRRLPDRPDKRRPQPRAPNDEKGRGGDERQTLKLSRNRKARRCSDIREAFMRLAFVAVFILIAGAAAAIAQPGRPYEVYVFDPADGPEVYAFAAPSRALALEIRGCGDFSVLANADSVVRQMRERRRLDAISVSEINGRQSRVEFGWCGLDDDEDEDIDDDPQDMLLVIDDLNAGQIRRIVRSLDAAPEATREQWLAQLGLAR
jgi:hypothetical protein